MTLNHILSALLLVILSSSRLIALDLPYSADVNNDGRVNILDLLRVRDALSESPSSSQGFWHDVNVDGRIDILDMILTRNELGTRLPARQLAFDLGPAGSPAAPGAIPVDQTLAYDPQAGYGWVFEGNESALSSVDRGWADPLDRDAVSGTQAARFRIDLPGGAYRVRVNMAYTNGSYMHFAVSAPSVSGGNYIDWRYGQGDAWLHPSAKKNVLRDMNVVCDDHIEIIFYASSGDAWAASAIEVRPPLYDLVLHDVHLAPQYPWDFSPPTRDSNLSFVSQTLGDYQADWDYLVQWYSDVVDDQMNDEQKVKAVIQKIFDSLELRNNARFHPVDVVEDGKGACEHRALLFQYVAHTLGLPTRGGLLLVPPEARYNGAIVSEDPLSYAALYHSVCEVYYDGTWHFFNTNFGELYDCSIVEVIADPGIPPILSQEFPPSNPINSPLFFADVRELVFLMDINQWRTSGHTLEAVLYTPLTARTLYGDTLPSYPFRLQTGRPGFADDERVLPLYRFPVFSYGALEFLSTGDTVRQQVVVSPVTGIDRLSNQLNVKWHPAPDTPDAANLVLRLTVNGIEQQIARNVQPDSAGYVPVILPAPADMLVDGVNTIDIQLASDGLLEIPHVGYRDDSGLVFPVAGKAPADDPQNFQPFTSHIFWNIDLVYRIESRTSPGSTAIDLSSLAGVQKSIVAFPHFPPSQCTGGDVPSGMQPLDDWSLTGDGNDILVVRRVPSFVRIFRQGEQ
ncbi:MAG TPA: dockerin type I domain-containing protein [Planctomycetota bacterium]|nr:dockerin type I domain-containing protein [Planctomycetota bacterium]